MHIKIAISTSLPTHRVARALWVPESYTLHELSDLLHASIGWDQSDTYSFDDGARQHIPCSQIQSDEIEGGIFLAEGTSLSELLSDWRSTKVTYRAGSLTQFDFVLEVQEVQESHPDNMTALLLDGQGDMPRDASELRRKFLEEHEQYVSGDFVLLKKLQKAHSMVEHTIGICTELVAARSVEISRMRKLPQY